MNMDAPAILNVEETHHEEHEVHEENFCIQLILRDLRALRGKSLLKCRHSI
jgi:hypothetical protein